MSRPLRLTARVLQIHSLAMPEKNVALISNPFKYKGSLDPKADSLVFIPRKKPLDGILRRTRQGEWTIVIGGKKVGKSSLVNELIARGQDELADHVFLLAKMKDIDFSDARALYREVADKFCTQVQRSKPRFKYALGTVNTPAEFKDLLFRLGREYKDKSGVVLVLDGIEAVPEDMLKQFLQTLGVAHSARSATPEYGKFRVVATGAVHPIDIADPSKGPFSEVAQVVILHEFEREEIEQMVRGALDASEVDYEEEVPLFVVREVGGTAYLAQKICFDVIEAAVARGEEPRLTVKNTAAAADRIVHEGEANLLWIARQMKGDADLLDKTLQVLDEYRVEGISVEPVLRKLEALGVVKREGDSAAIRNWIYERFFRSRLTPERVADLYLDIGKPENARVFYQKALEGHRRTEQALRAIAEASRDLSGELDQRRLFRIVLDKIKEIGDVRVCSIMLVKEGKLEPVAHEGYDKEHLEKLSLTLGEGVSGWVAKNRRRRIVRDVLDKVDCPEFKYPEMAEKAGVRTLACIPLSFKDEVLGVLNAYFPGPIEIPAPDVVRLETLAGHIAVAIKTVQSYEVSEKILSEDSFEKVLSLIGEEALNIVGRGMRHCFMLLYDGLRNRLVIRAERGVDVGKSYAGYAIPVAGVNGRSIAAKAAREGRPILVKDTRSGTGAEDYLEVAPHLHSAVAVPMMFKGKAIGVIEIESTETDAFAEEDVKLLQVLAAHAVVACKTKHEALMHERQLNALRHVNERIVGGMDIDSVLEAVAQGAESVIGGSDQRVFYIMLLDQERDALTIRFATGQEGLCRSYVGKSFTRADKCIGWRVIQENRCEVHPDVKCYGSLAADLDYGMIHPDVKTNISAPIFFQQKPLGVIGVESFNDVDFFEYDMGLLKALADSVGAAIEMARLRRESIERQRRLARAVLYEQISLPIHSILGSCAQLGTDLYHLRSRLSSLPDWRQIETRWHEVEQEVKKVDTATKSLRQPWRQPKLGPTDLNEVLRKAVVEMAEKAKARGVELEQSLLDRPLVCNLDMDRMVLALANVIRNSIEADASKVLVRSRQEDGWAVAEIEDDGPGIAREMLDKLNAGYEVTSTKPGGQGFGLAGVRDVVETIHAGQIRLSSEPGKGTTVVLHIRLTEPTRLEGSGN